MTIDTLRWNYFLGYMLFYSKCSTPKKKKNSTARDAVPVAWVNCRMDKWTMQPEDWCCCDVFLCIALQSPCWVPICKFCFFCSVTFMRVVTLATSESCAYLNHVPAVLCTVGNYQKFTHCQMPWRTQEFLLCWSALVVILSSLNVFCLHSS